MTASPRDRENRVRAHLPWKRFFSLAMDVFWHRRRSFLADCEAMLKCITHRWEGIDHLPAKGPFVLIANHYQRADLWIGWAAALVTVAVARRTQSVARWVALEDLVVEVRGRTIPFPGAAWAFERVTHSWDMIPTTDWPNPRRRAKALRAVLGVLRDGGVVGLFPEGSKGNAESFGPFLPGIGRLFELLNRSKVSIVPVGIREDHGVLVAHFGPPVDFRESEGEENSVIARMAVANLLTTSSPRGATS